MITERENYIRNATFNYPEWIPIRVAISDATWDQLREDLESVVIRHPVLFPVPANILPCISPGIPVP